MKTKVILELEIAITKNRIKEEEKLKANLENAFAEGEITYEEFETEIEDIHENIYQLNQNIEVYEFLINKYCKRA